MLLIFIQLRREREGLLHPFEISTENKSKRLVLLEMIEMFSNISDSHIHFHFSCTE